MGESQYSRHFRSKIPKIWISKNHQKWSKLCSGEWNGTRKWCFGAVVRLFSTLSTNTSTESRKCKSLCEKVSQRAVKVPSIITTSNILIFAHQQNSRTLSGESLVSLTTFLFSVSFHSETLETRVSYLTTKQNRISPENGAFQTKIVFWNELNSDWTLLERIFTSGFHLRTWCSWNTRSVVEP